MFPSNEETDAADNFLQNGLRQDRLHGNQKPKYGSSIRARAGKFTCLHDGKSPQLSSAAPPEMPPASLSLSLSLMVALHGHTTGWGGITPPFAAAKTTRGRALYFRPCLGQKSRPSILPGARAPALAAIRRLRGGERRTAIDDAPLLHGTAAAAPAAAPAAVTSAAAPAPPTAAREKAGQVFPAAPATAVRRSSAGRRGRPASIAAAAAVSSVAAAAAAENPGDADAADARDPTDAEGPGAPQTQHRAAAARVEQKAAPASDPPAREAVLYQGEVEHRLVLRPSPSRPCLVLLAVAMSGGALEEGARAVVVAAGVAPHPFLRVHGRRASQGQRG